MSKATTETHKVGKILKGGEFVVLGPKGWVDKLGNVVEVKASPKFTTFFDDMATAKALGFSPTEVQKAIIASWTAKPAAPAAPAAPTK